MCLIAFTNDGLFLTDAQRAYTRLVNKDGMGVMCLNGGRVNIRKSLKEVPIPYNTLQFAVHWRMATHGEISRKGAHPHWVLNRHWGDPYDVALMHNGVFSGNEFYTDDGRSDTQVWISDYLRPILLSSPTLIHSVPFWSMVSAWVDAQHSKVLLLSDVGGWIALPDFSEWPIDDETGTTISNTYSLGKLSGKTSGWPYKGINSWYDEEKYQYPDSSYKDCRLPSV